LIELTDLLATCASLVGTKLPAGMGADSRNALPALLQPKPEKRVREYSIHHSLWGVFAIRKGNWKLIPHRGSGGFTFPRELNPDQVGGPPGQLYDLSKDPAETKNVWEQNPDIVKSLSLLLAQVRAADQ
jgi:arylsulfatase A-like enzyme